MKALMVDIEAFTTAEKKASIIQIGWAVFEPFSRKGTLVGSGKMNTVPPKESKFDLETCLWWLAQGEVARLSVASANRLPLKTALAQLCGIYRSYECEQVWARGVKYDIGNIEYWMRKMSLAPPWAYNQVRDSRSCTDINKPERNLEFWPEHDAEADASYQAMCVIQHFKRELE